MGPFVHPFRESTRREVQVLLWVLLCRQQPHPKVLLASSLLPAVIFHQAWCFPGVPFGLGWRKCFHSIDLLSGFSVAYSLWVWLGDLFFLRDHSTVRYEFKKTGGGFDLMPSKTFCFWSTLRVGWMDGWICKWMEEWKGGENYKPVVHW